MASSKKSGINGNPKKLFMKKKNKIIKKITGITLIPKEMLVEVAPKPLWHTSTGSCPYCVDDGGCNTCPMVKHDNACDEISSTWQKVFKAMDCKVAENPEIIKLVKKFNKSHGFPEAETVDDS